MALSDNVANLTVSNGGAGDFAGYLTPEQSEAIFERAAQTSVVQQLARQITLGPSGKNIPVFTGDVEADWVAETGNKPITKGAVGLKNIQPQKIAAIFVASAEVVRANPANYMSVMRNKVAEAMAKAFDAAALHGVNTPFGAGNYIGATTKVQQFGSEANTYLDINAGLAQLVNDGYTLEGFAFDVKAEPVLNASVDNAGRPIWVDAPYTESNVAIRPGRMLGRPAFVGKGVGNEATDTLGFAGDWSQAVWGVVGGISYDVSDQATLPIGDGDAMVSLWRNNLVAVRAEAEFGFLVNDPEAFVEFTGGTTGS